MFLIPQSKYFVKNKKIIFFDGDGTIWYPKNSKRKKPPHWIYSDKTIGSNYLSHLILTPSALVSLKKLRKLGIILVLLSTHPHSPKEADIILKGKVKHFKLEGLFDHFYTSRDNPKGKGEMILKVLRKEQIPKSHALMVGDSYRFDYLSAKKVGVDALLIKSEYMKHPPRGKKIQNTINELKDVVEVLMRRNKKLFSTEKI
jgi:FMN phosphatase YigB (HAD superfamily)